MTATQQIAHILRKDLRAHVSEIASLGILNLLLILFTVENWADATQHTGLANLESAGPIRIAIGAMLVVAWMLLIARLIHSEAPASHTQAWLTRPYSRSFLLIEKALFIVLFVHLLTALSQILILLLSGVPFSIGSIAVNHLVLLCFVSLPIAVVASLTSTLGRFLLVMIPAFQPVAS